jgi:cell division GTPase FtsZ
MTKEELRKRFDQQIVIPNDHFNHRGGLVNEVWDFFWAEIEKRDKEIDSWEEEVLKLGEEVDKLQTQLSKYKEREQENIDIVSWKPSRK